MLEFDSNAQIRVGIKQSSRAIAEGKASKVFVAKDADVSVVNKVLDLAKANDVPVELVETMRLLGKACKIDVGAATAVILK